MFEENNKNNRETETAFTFAMLLMNIMIFVIVGAAAWLAHTVVTQINELNVFLRGGFLP